MPEITENNVAVRVSSQSLADYAEAVRSFHDLISVLTRDTGATIDWEITQLEVGSPTVTGVTGYSDNSAAVLAVVNGYTDFGSSLRKREPAVTANTKLRTVRKRFLNLVEKKDHVDWVRFETTNNTIEVLPTPIEATTQDEIAAFESLDTITGHVTAINEKGGLHFNLTDELTYRSVVCWVQPSETATDLLRRIWRQRVVVEGLVKRDALDAHPTQVRDISDNSVYIMPNAVPGIYRDALGLVPWKDGDQPSEDIIRKMRDAW